MLVRCVEADDVVSVPCSTHPNSLGGYEPLVEVLDTACYVPVVISSNKQLNSNFRLVAVSKFETLFLFEVGNVVVRWWQQVSADLRHLKCFYVDSGVVVTVFSATSLYPMTASFLQRRPVSEDIDGQPLLSCVMEL